MTFEEYKNNVEQLNKWTAAYDAGFPEVSDKTWDDLYFKIAAYERDTGNFIEESPTKSIYFPVVDSLKKVKHNHPMLSLDKTKSIEDLIHFCKGQNICAMAKMDGLTCSLLYKDGKLVGAETRGNGEVGEDIFHNIAFVKGVPKELPIDMDVFDEVIIDGEIICTYHDFIPFENKYKNPRNFASGSIRLLDSLESAKRHLTFVAWDCIKGLDRCESLYEKLDILEYFGGFVTVPKVMIEDNSKESINNAIHLIKGQSQIYEYPIDGVVFKYDDCEYYESCGQTNHHAKGGIGFKFYDETYPTRLRTISWTMGRTGQLTPVAVFDPVEIDGSVVERASLHNVSVMRELLGPCAYYGQTLEVFKANQIIPQIASSGPHYDYGTVIAHGGVSAHDVLKRCPYCGGEVELRQDGVAEIYYCTNPNCDGKLINKLDHFCGKKGLDIKGLSKATLEKLTDWEWVSNFEDLFTLEKYKSEWIKKSGFGVASVEKILSSIESSRTTELWRIIAAAGIPLIGSTASKALANYYETWDSFREAVDNNVDFSELPDFGSAMNYQIHNYDFSVMDKVVQYLDYAAPAPVTTQGLDGLQFCITGKVTQWKNRDALKEYIESLGGKVTGSVTKKTSYLINNDSTSTTAKNQAAQKLNVPIITEEEFIALCNERS